MSSTPQESPKNKPAPPAGADVGAILRSTRVKQGRSLEEVNQHTKIPKRLLENLEANRFETFVLPYLRGFLKNYCDYLEIDFQPLWQMVESGREAASAPKKAPAPAGSSHPPTHAPAPSGHSATSAHSAPARMKVVPLSTEARVARAVLLTVTLGLFVFLWASRGSESASHGTLPGSLETFGHRTQSPLGIFFRGDAWLELSVDNKAMFKGKAPQGSRQEWKILRSATIRTADPHAMEFTLNGAPYELPAPDSSGVSRIDIP